MSQFQFEPLCLRKLEVKSWPFGFRAAVPAPRFVTISWGPVRGSNARTRHSKWFFTAAMPYSRTAARGCFMGASARGVSFRVPGGPAPSKCKVAVTRRQTRQQPGGVLATFIPRRGDRAQRIDIFAKACSDIVFC